MSRFKSLDWFKQELQANTKVSKLDAIPLSSAALESPAPFAAQSEGNYHNQVDQTLHHPSTKILPQAASTDTFAFDSAQPSEDFRVMSRLQDSSQATLGSGKAASTNTGIPQVTVSVERLVGNHGINSENDRAKPLQPDPENSRVPPFKSVTCMLNLISLFNRCACCR